MGIETIYQDLALADNLDVGENVFLGRELKTSVLGFIPMLDRRRMRALAHDAIETLDMDIRRLDRPVRNLSGGQRQAVAIGRAIYWNAEILIMDEPTAALGVPEQRKVMALIKKLKQQNVAVLFISHNLIDIMEVADRIVVLRRGEVAGERRKADIDSDEVVRLMVGG
jgi:simple sugar transport system ATP-binding protein